MSIERYTFLNCLLWFCQVMHDLLIILSSSCFCTGGELSGLLPAVQHIIQIFIETVEIAQFLSLHLSAWQQLLHGYSCCFSSLLNVLALAVSVPSPTICLAGSLTILTALLLRLDASSREYTISCYFFIQKLLKQLLLHTNILYFNPLYSVLSTYGCFLQPPLFFLGSFAVCFSITSFIFLKFPE